MAKKAESAQAAPDKFADLKVFLKVLGVQQISPHIGPGGREQVALPDEPFEAYSPIDGRR